MKENIHFGGNQRINEVMNLNRLFILLFSILSFISFSFVINDVHAADSFVDSSGWKVYGNKIQDVGYDKGGTDITSVMTDGDAETYVTSGLDHANLFYRTIYIKFSSDGSTTIDVNKLFIKFKSGGNESLFTTTYYDSTGKILYSSGAGNTTLTPNLKGVAGIKFHTNGSFYVKYFFADFSVTGTVHEPEKPELYNINNLQSNNLSSSSFRATWDAVKGLNLQFYRIRLNNSEVSTTKNYIDFVGLNRDLIYNVDVSAVDIFDKEYLKSNLVYEFPPPDLIPPNKPIGLIADSDIYTSTLKWILGNDDDLAGYDVYLNGSKMNSALIVGNSFLIKSLSPITEYEVYLIAVDATGNRSVASDTINFKTKPILLAPEKSPVLTAYTGNGSVNLSWSAVIYADRYNIYQDNEKIIETNATHLNLKKLSNGRSYEFYVSAENDIGISPNSNVVVVIPDEKLIPGIDLEFGLSDVANGTSYWFSSIWRILAFVISIPLAFYIANRSKGLINN